MITHRVLAMALVALAGGDEGVERDAEGVPVAFRVWKAGANPTDYGVHYFTEASARALMAEQAMRGNLYSIDVDHLSLNEKAPIENRKAVGWHRLEVRDGDLWAIRCEWTPAVRSGLASRPPEWRYFSPAYDVSKETSEITSYLNTAITNNPATWSVTALASSTTTQRRTSMNYNAIAAALMGDDDEKKKEAKATLAGMSDLEKKAYKAWKKATFDDNDGDEAPKKEETAQAAEPSDEEKKKEEEAKRAAAANASTVAATAELLTKVGTLEKTVADLDKVRVDSERSAILAARKDLTESQRKFLADKSPAEVTAILAAMFPADKAASVVAGGATNTAAAASADVQATRGSGNDQEVRAARLPPAEHEDLVERMGGVTKSPVIHWERSARVFPTIDRDEALRVLARHKAAVPLGSPAGVMATIETARRAEAARNGA